MYEIDLSEYHFGDVFTSYKPKKINGSLSENMVYVREYRHCGRKMLRGSFIHNGRVYYKTFLTPLYGEEEVDRYTAKALRYLQHQTEMIEHIDEGTMLRCLCGTCQFMPDKNDSLEKCRIENIRQQCNGSFWCYKRRKDRSKATKLYATYKCKCKYCGKTFTVHNRRYIHDYCNSAECMRAHKSEEINGGNFSARGRKMAMKTGAEYEHICRAKLLNEATNCALCGKKLDRNTPPNHPSHPHIDHIVPLSRGGSHTYGNVRVLCAECNLHKGAKTDLEYMTQRKKARYYAGN